MANIMLSARGIEDKWFSEEPSRTYFASNYQKNVNRSRQTIEIPFDNEVTTFGGTGICTIPVKGDYLARLTLRTILPPIYPTVPGQYVFPTPSSEVGATVSVDKNMDLVVADGTTLTANTVGNHYFSVGAQVTLSGTSYLIFNLDGVYTIASIPTANSFTCSTTLAGVSYNGTASSPGIQCGDIISYFSTANSNLWVNNVTNKTWVITSVSNVGTTWTFTTSEPSNFPVGSSIILNLPNSGFINYVSTVTATTGTTFNITIDTIPFVMSGDLSTGAIQAYSYDDGKTWTRVSPPVSFYGPIAYGNGTFVMIDSGKQAYSSDNGRSWNLVGSPLSGIWTSVAFGNGVFVMIGYSNSTGGGVVAYSATGKTWTTPASSPPGYWNSIAYGNGVFVAIGVKTSSPSSNSKIATTSSDYGLTWTAPYIITANLNYSIYWKSITFGNGVFVIVGRGGSPCTQAYSTDNGASWTTASSPIAGDWESVAFGNGVFVMVGLGISAYSNDNGVSWISSSGGGGISVTFGNGVFHNCNAYSTNGQTWTPVTPHFAGGAYVAAGEFTYTTSPSDSVSLATPPLQLASRSFSSNVYPSISFANAADAAFWGFDARQGLTYSLPATPPWTYTQSGWISGFLPPSSSTWDDSVAHKLCKSVRLLVGKQTVKEYTGEYIELQNDLLVPYESKAILKLMNGTLDQTQAIVPREYYVNLPMGLKEIPLCALTRQQVSVEVDFESYMNLSQNLNQGSGDFLDAKSYTTYNASAGILGGQPVNVQTTFSYQQYIFLVTYGGQFIIFDTTKNVDDPTSYTVLSAFSGSNLFKQFCVLSGYLYIGLTNGQLVRMILSELIQGNISSFLLNNYSPTIGSLTGTMVADFRYVYYTVSNTATSNVFVSRYDTLGTFTSTSSYTIVDFTKNFNSNVTGVYQTLATGTELILLPQGTPRSLYTYQLNANVQTQWYLLDYSLYGNQITEGVLVGSNTLYFVAEKFLIIKYLNSSFTTFYTLQNAVVSVGSYAKTASSYDYGNTWNVPYIPDTSGYLEAVAYGNGVFVTMVSSNGDGSYSTDNGRIWIPISPSYGNGVGGIAFGNNTFVVVGWNNNQAYSTDNGKTWTSVASPLAGTWKGTTYGNGVFVMFGTNIQAYSTDNGRTWTSVASPLAGTWNGTTYGNGVFVMVGLDTQAYSTDNGRTWTAVASPLSGTFRAVGFTNGVFVSASYNDGVYSTDNGKSWNFSTTSVVGDWYSFATNPAYIVPGDGLRNLLAVGNYIYASTNNVAVRIDTTKDLSTAAAYSFPAPLPTNQYVFTNGPRYVYMLVQGDNSATNIVEYDPYGPNTTLKASILVDYETLPPEVPKPDKALLGLVQTQKVQDMNFMNIKGPVKELWITGNSASTNVFQYSNLSDQTTLTLTGGEQIVTEDVGMRTFLNEINPFETHTSMPIRNFSVVPFEIDPESPVPNGTVNFSRMRDQTLDANAQTVWARTYNLLTIHSGVGGLMFN